MSITTVLLMATAPSSSGLVRRAIAKSSATTSRAVALPPLATTTSQMKPASHQPSYAPPRYPNIVYGNRHKQQLKEILQQDDADEDEEDVSESDDKDHSHKYGSSQHYNRSRSPSPDHHDKENRKYQYYGCGFCGCSWFFFAVILAFTLINLACFSTIWYPVTMGWVVAIATLVLVIPFAFVELWFAWGVALVFCPWILYRLLFLGFFVFGSIYSFLLFYWHGYWVITLLFQAFLLNIVVLLSIRIWWYWYPTAPGWIVNEDGTATVVGERGGYGGNSPYGYPPSNTFFFPGVIWCGAGWAILLILAMILHFAGFIAFGQYWWGWQGGFTMLVVGLFVDAVILFVVAGMIGLLPAVLSMFYTRQWGPAPFDPHSNHHHNKQPCCDHQCHHGQQQKFRSSAATSSTMTTVRR